MRDTVTILLALYQGETYLPAQLSSLLRLTGPRWRLLDAGGRAPPRHPAFQVFKLVPAGSEPVALSTFRA